MSPLQAVILAAWLVFEGIMIIVLGAFTWDAIRATVKNRRIHR